MENFNKNDIVVVTRAKQGNLSKNGDIVLYDSKLIGGHYVFLPTLGENSFCYNVRMANSLEKINYRKRVYNIKNLKSILIQIY